MDNNKKVDEQVSAVIGQEDNVHNPKLWESVFLPNAQEAAQFAKDVKRLWDSKKSYPQPAIFTTPLTYLTLNNLRPNLEVKKLMMTLNKEDIRKIMGFQQGKSFGHDLTIEQVQALPTYLSNPLLILNNSDRGLVAIIDVMNLTTNKPYFVPIHLNKLYQRKTSNEIASVYHRTNLKNWLGYNRDDGKTGLEKDILYFREERSRESTRLSQIHGNQNTNQMLISLLGVGALKDLTNSRSANSFPIGRRILNSEDIVKFYIEKHLTRKTEQNLPIIDLSGLCPREAGRKLFKETQGDVSQLALMMRSATAAGLKLDTNAIIAAQGQHSMIIQEVMMKAVSIEPQRNQQERFKQQSDKGRDR